MELLVYMKKCMFVYVRNGTFVYVQKRKSVPFFDVSTIVSLRVLTHVYKPIHVCIRTLTKFVYKPP